METTLENYIGIVSAEMTLITINKEVDNKLYLPQSAFDSCLHRAKSFNEALKERIDQIIAYATIRHREDSHEENYDEEKAMLLYVMDAADVKVVDENYRGWWVG